MRSLKEKFVKNGILERGHWKLSSGRHAEDYVFKEKLICTNPDLFDTVNNSLLTLVLESIDLKDFDLLSGPAVMGIPFVVPIAIGVDKPFVLPEKDVTSDIIIDGKMIVGKNEMKFRPDFQKAIKGKRVILIEDIVTSRASLLKTAKVIYQCGGDVVAMFCIWDRQPDRIFLKPKFLSIKGNIPLYSLISEEILSWDKEKCPVCNQNIPLLDPKTGLVIS